MAITGTGFYDASQDLYLPKDTLTWANLGSSPYTTWDSYDTWYKNLSSSTTVAFTSEIIDFGRSAKVFPLITITALKDGDTATSATFGSEATPQIAIEGSDNSDMSSATTVTMTRASANNTFTGLGSKRYYRVTITIDSGTNTAPQGFRGVNIVLLTEAIEEVITDFNTATVDDGSSTTRQISTVNNYSDITFVGLTAKTEITDTVVTGTSGSSAVFYVADGYVVSGYFVGDTGSSSVTTSNISIPPLIRLVSTSTDSFVVQVYKPNTAEDTNTTLDALIKGLPEVAVDVEGNLVRTT